MTDKRVQDLVAVNDDVALAEMLMVAWAEVEKLREALQAIIDCPDFSAKRAFTMKMIAREALAVPLPEEPQ